MGSDRDVNNEIRVTDEEGKEYSIKGTRIHMYEYIDRMLRITDNLKRAYGGATRRFDENSNVLDNIEFLINECENIIINRARFEDGLEQKFYKYYQTYVNEQERGYFEEFKVVDTDLNNLVLELNSLVGQSGEIPAVAFADNINSLLYRINVAMDRVNYTDRELSPTLSRAMENSHTMDERESQESQQTEELGPYDGKLPPFGSAWKFEPPMQTSPTDSENPIESMEKIPEKTLNIEARSSIPNIESKQAVESTNNEVPNQGQENLETIHRRRRRSRRRRMDRYKTDQMITNIQDYEFSASTLDADIAELMSAFGIAEDSEFYDYIKARIDFASVIHLGFLDDMMRINPNYMSPIIYYYLKEIKEQNEDLIEGRYRHYELYRGLDSDAPTIEDIKDKNGRTYFSKIVGLDSSSIKKLNNFIKGIYEQNMTPEELEKIAIDIEHDLLRVKKFDESLEVASENIIASGKINPSLRLVDEEEKEPKKAKKRVFKGNEKVKKLVDFARENPGKTVATLGATILLGTTIAGVNPISFNDIVGAINDKVIEPIVTQYEYETLERESRENQGYAFSIDEETAKKLEAEQRKRNNEAILLGTELAEQERLREIEEQRASQVATVTDTSLEQTESSSQTVLNETENRKEETPIEVIENPYCFADVVGSLTKEEIELYGNAINKGDTYVPNGVYAAYSLSGGIGKIDTAQELKLAFERIDSMLAGFRGNVNSHMLSYQGVELGEAIIKQHISEVYNVPLDKIGFYYNMPKDGTGNVSKVDILLLDANGQKERTLARNDLMDYRLQEALKMIGGLKDTRNKVSVFEESEKIYDFSKREYTFLRNVLTGKYRFERDGIRLKIVEPGIEKIQEDNGEIDI